MSLLRNVVVDKHSSAVFTDNDFFVHLDFALALGRYLAEAAATGITVDGDDGKAVAGLLADALVCRQIVLVDKLLLLG